MAMLKLRIHAPSAMPRITTAITDSTSVNPPSALTSFRVIVSPVPLRHTFPFKKSSCCTRDDTFAKEAKTLGFCGDPPCYVLPGSLPGFQDREFLSVVRGASFAGRPSLPWLPPSPVRNQQLRLGRPTTSGQNSDREPDRSVCRLGYEPSRYLSASICHPCRPACSAVRWRTSRSPSSVSRPAQSSASRRSRDRASSS